MSLDVAAAPESGLEVQILLCAARTQPDLAARNRLEELLVQTPDWDALLAAAARHHVLPLLHLNLKGSPHVPEAVRLRIEAEAGNTALRNRFLAGELIRLLRLLETSGISTVSFKGPTLAEDAYGSLELRQYADVDILVHKSDFLAARTLLQKEGFRLVKDDAEQILASSAGEASYGFEHDNGACVDLQWGVTITRDFAFPVDSESFWRRLETAQLAGSPVRHIPSPDLLQILCLHGSRHQWHRLQWIADIAELISSQRSMPWNQILTTATDLGNRRTLLLGLRLARDLLGTTLPPSVGDLLSDDRTVKALSTQVAQRLSDGAEGELVGADRHVFNLRLKERHRDRVLYLARKASSLHREDVGQLRLPRAFSLLYYPRRAVRLMSQYGSSSAGMKKILGALFDNRSTP